MRRYLALFLALLLALTGCAAHQEGGDGLLVYYAVQDASALGEPSVRGVPWPEDGGAATVDAVFRQMQVRPADGTLGVVFPENLRLLSWSLEEGTLLLHLSEEYSGLAGISLTVANYCLVLTMSQLEGVEAVAITSAGLPVPEEGVRVRTAADVLLTGELPDPTLVGLQLYFPLSDGSGLGLEYREVQLHDVSAQGLAAAVIELLAAGPGSPEMASPFQALENQLACEQVDEVCRVTLTEGWAEVLRTDELARRALVNSLCTLDGVTCVAFSCPGEADGLEGTFFFE